MLWGVPGRTQSKQRYHPASPRVQDEQMVASRKRKHRMRSFANDDEVVWQEDGASAKFDAMFEACRRRSDVL